MSALHVIAHLCCQMTDVDPVTLTYCRMAEQDLCDGQCKCNAQFSWIWRHKWCWNVL